MLAMNFLSSTYNVSIKAQRSKTLNILEIFNEIIIMNVTILMVLFTEFNPDEVSQNEYGWLYICFILITMFVNLCFIFLDIINNIRIIVIMIYNRINHFI